MQTQTNATAAAVALVRPIFTLPIIALRPDVIRLAPGAITDAAVRAAVDGKLNAALKQEIKQAIGSDNAAVGTLVDGLPLDYHALLGETVLSIIQKTVVPAMERQPALAPLVAGLLARRDVAGAPTVAALLQPNLPLAQNPIFIDDVRQGKGRELLRLASLDQNLIDKIDGGRKQLEAWNDFDWDNVVKQNILTAAQRDQLHFTTDLSRLTGEQYGLVEAAQKAALNTVNDLVQWDSSRWLDLIRKNPASVPEGLTPEAYAGQLAKVVQQTYPSEYFSYRIADKTLAQNSPQAYRHLGLAENPARVDALGLFLKNNAGEDLRFINLLDNQPRRDGALNWTGIAAADQTPVRNQLLAYQRVLHLASDHDAAMALLRVGLDSSAAIGTMSYSAFKAQTGLDDASAAPIYADAQFRSAKIANGVQLTKDAVAAIEQGRYFQGINPSAFNDLKDIPGYTELFGGSTFCDCVHCRSIFSPAAYFTDLMYFIDKNITQKAFANKPTHPLRLDKRRPDLWKLKLTCDNTDTLIPQLTLVKEILESYITQTLSVGDVEQTLAGDRTAIGLPYHAPLETVREYLRDWNTELSGVYELLNATSDAKLKKSLHLSNDEWNALIAAPADTAWVRFPTSDRTQMDAMEFLGFADITRAQLDELQLTKTAGGFTIVRVKQPDDIQSEKEVVQGLSDPLLDHIGRLLRLARKTGLSLLELDEAFRTPVIAGGSAFSAQSFTGLARFRRLQQTLGLSVESLVGVVDHIPVGPMKTGAKSLADQLGVPALAGPGGFPITFHHAHFNTANPSDATVDATLPALLNVIGLTESDLLMLFLEYPAAFPFDANGNCQLTPGNVALLYAHAMLARAWHITPGDLSQVINRLGFPGNDFRTLDRLEQLQQAIATHASLPLAISEAFALLDPATSWITTDQVVSVVAGLRQSGARLFGPSILASLPGFTAEDAANIFAQLLQANLLEEEGDKYALSPAYTPATDLGAGNVLTAPYLAHKNELHAAFMAFHFTNLLPNSLAAIAGMQSDKTLIALAFAQPGWDGAPILQALKTTIVNGVATTPADLAPLTKLANDLARLGRLFSRLQLETADGWFIAQYPGIFGIQDIRQLRASELATMRRYRQLLSASTPSSADWQNLLWQYQVRANGNQPIAPAAVFSAVATVPLFAGALASPAHLALTPAAAPSFSSQVLVASPLNADEIELLATGNGLEPTLLRSIFLSQTLPAGALDGISRALRLYPFCDQLDIQGYSLAKLLVRDFPGLKNAGKSLWSLREEKNSNPGARKKNLPPHSGALNMLLRDALCNYIIARSDTLKFQSRDEIYSYFLIDVQVGGCFETSRLVAALSSLQLYVYRCLIDLEQSEKDNFSVLSFIDAADISQEWEWRKNYRVWEANRKVFLYPENYIEPELRDNKTPLFQDLEDNLLQRKITLDAAEEAYKQYLTGFSTLAQLKVVGVCFDHDDQHPENDCYWFLARTNSDPYQYYLRRYFPGAGRWDAWETVDLGISAPYVSPLVCLGRLYLFWVEITSMDKTSFASGNSIFQGVDHQVMLHYSYRQHDGKWAAAQKKTLVEHFRDFLVVDNSPIYYQLTGYAFLAVDKNGTKQMVQDYQNTKTYGKVIATADDPGQPEKLTIHYFRKFGLSNVLVQSTSDPQQFNWISEEDVDDIFTVRKVHFGYSDPKNPLPVPASHYFTATLDLALNELSDSRLLKGDFDPNTEAGYYDPSNGIEAMGILETNDATQMEFPPFSLMMRNYAEAEFPMATDDMLVTYVSESVTPVTNTLVGEYLRDVIPVNNNQGETVLQHGKHQHWLQYGSAIFESILPQRVAVRVNTTLDGYLTKALFTGGIQQFLTLGTQSTSEEPPRLQPTNGIASFMLQFASEPLDALPFHGSFGDYYRELFFHIPFLIANQLNAEGQYSDAKYWYEKIFNPTAPPLWFDPNPKNRVWQYLEFLNVDVPKLKELLTDQAQIDLYQDDPFNPHAIARLRLSAYQKAIVMKYVSNLVDWADQLFTQDTMESVNEATMLYVLAADILGPRPVSVGECETADENALTYDTLGPAIEKGSEFLMFVENIYLQFDLEAAVALSLAPAKANPKAHAMSASLLSTGLGSPRQYQRKPTLPSYKAANTAKTHNKRHPNRPDIVRQYLPAFCVPANDVLLGYWDRIEDRLFKIRNCQNIHGERVSLALFQPPIDPMLLVRAKAAGLSLEEIVGQENEALPTYRFSYLVEKARQYVSTVQSFGGALLSALEKKDAEGLSLLRSTHEKNILSMQRSIKQQQIDEAQAQLDSLRSQQQNVQNRIQYYNDLIQGGLNAAEWAEETLRHSATALKTIEGIYHTVAGIEYLLPKAGSPFALTYGGKEMGDHASAIAQWYASSAGILDAGSASAGLEATFQRRSQEWQQQLTLAQEEMNQVTKQVTAAEIRLQIAIKDLDVHDKQVDQSQEILDFLTNKFSSVGLYTFMSAQLMRLYREAYQMAAKVARQAERAYQFERDATDFFIQSDNWQAESSGLLAGERLLLQLQRLEQAYMERNTREIEVSQSLSLLQIDPGALQSLQQTGKCSFKLDEIWFDLQYPGHYRRLLKSVRLTVPCVVGPYTNVGAKLQLMNSWVRRKTDLQGPPEPVPLTMTGTIATSHAQNDAGLFELNFRDERYLPFEGAGAISQWTFELPAKVRMFDYSSISDVVINLSYLTRYDDTLGKTVEDNLVAGAQTLKTYSQQPGLFRLISLRHEFPDAFQQLLNPPAGQPQQTTFALESRHFPVWLDSVQLQGTTPQTVKVTVWPHPAKGQNIDVSTLSLKVAGVQVGNWTADGKGSASMTGSGSPIRSWTIDAGINGLDKTKLGDLQLLIQYTLQ